jgi:hypothetical protein
MHLGYWRQYNVGFSVTGNHGQDDGIGQMTSNGDGTIVLPIVHTGLL